jgi:hypothetical protein
MKKAVIITALFISVFLNPHSQVKAEEVVNLMFVNETVTRDTNLHYTGKFCNECHEQKPEEGGETLLKFKGDYSQLCRCHGYTSENYIHPVDIVPSEEKKTKIPDKMPLTDGKLTCTSCHDIYKQCQDDMQTRSRDKFFLRGAPFGRRTDLCFKCHDESKYKMLDPHNQLDEKGDIIVEKCLYCHVEKPDEKRSTFKERKGIHGTVVKLIGNLEVLCYRCHYKQSTLHPINANHFQKPSEKTLQIMKETEKILNIILPLNYEGKVTCATCHNPHERGVLPQEKEASKGAGEKFRLRLPGLSGEICSACHKDKFGE